MQVVLSERTTCPYCKQSLGDIVIICEACKQPIYSRQRLINHHISYFPEKIVPVHSTCHGKIHKGTGFEQLCPDEREAMRFHKERFSDLGYRNWRHHNALIHFRLWLHRIETEKPQHPLWSVGLD